MKKQGLQEPPQTFGVGELPSSSKFGLQTPKDESDFYTVSSQNAEVQSVLHGFEPANKENFQ